MQGVLWRPLMFGVIPDLILITVLAAVALLLARAISQRSRN